MRKIGIGLVAFCMAMGVFLTSSTAEAKVKVSKTKIVLAVGENYSLSVKGAKKKVTWKSAKKKIATVTKRGIVKGKKQGTVWIKAKAGKKSARCKVVVKAKKQGAVVYNNKVFTEALLKNITSIKSSLVEEKVVSKEGIRQIYAVLAKAVLTEVPAETERLIGGLVLNVTLKDGTDMIIGAGAQVTYDGKRYFASPSVTDDIVTLLTEFAF